MNSETQRNAEACPACGYTQRDANLHADHRLCVNSGNAPWEGTKCSDCIAGDHINCSEESCPCKCNGGGK